MDGRLPERSAPRRLTVPACALLACSALAWGRPQASDPGAGQGARLSLEELLARVRERRTAVVETLGPTVQAALRAFSTLKPPIAKERTDELVEQLVALGPDAAALLVPYLDPAPAEGGMELERSRAVASALRRLPTPATTTALLAMLESGSSIGRIHALRALETSPEPERVGSPVRALFDASTGAVKEAALRACIRLGAVGADDLLVGVLGSSDAGLVDLALSALTQTQDARAAGAVRELLGSPERAARSVSGILGYYRAVPEAVTSDVLIALVEIARVGPALEPRLSVLEALPELGAGSASEVRKALDPLGQSPDRKLREAALVALTRLGDRGARRDLMRAYDELIDRNDKFADGYVRRAQVMARIGEYDSAIKDYQTALKLLRDDPRPQPEAYVGLARAYARRNRFKEAAEALRKAPISMKELRDLAEDPDFKGLRESRFGKEAFGE